MIWEPLLLSLQVAVLATFLVTLAGLGLAIWLARSDFWGKSLLEMLVSLPLILPPSVVGYYLLLFLGRSGPLYFLGVRIVFTWPAAVIASALAGRLLPMWILPWRKRPAP
jgi:molybdate transport system permease protein